MEDDNERIFHALDEVLPGDERILSNFQHVGILYHAFANEKFKNWTDMQYLEKADFWLSGFKDKCYQIKVYDESSMSFLSDLGIVNQIGWDKELEGKHDNVLQFRVSLGHRRKALKKSPRSQILHASFSGLMHPNLAKYIERAKLIAKDVKVQTFCNQFIDSMTRYFLPAKGKLPRHNMPGVSDTEEQEMPFWIICSSSGTGKSQFAYTLPVPAAYFLMTTDNSSTDQELYKPFNSISSMLNKIFQQDYADYTSKFHKTMLSVNQLCSHTSIEGSIQHKYFAVGFLVALFQNMVTLKKANPTDHWLKCQLMVQNLAYSAISIADGLIALTELRSQLSIKDSKLPFCVFMDECQLNSSQKKVFFRFTRNIMRGLHLCFIGMGTNASACNFADETISKHSRVSLNVWCHLIIKLPMLANTVLDQVKETASEALRAAHLKNKHTSLDYDFLGDFFDLFVKDRPLFAHLALKGVEQFLKQEPDGSSSDFFWNIMNGIFKDFYESKQLDAVQFANGQLAYFSTKYWGQILENPPKEPEWSIGEDTEFVVLPENFTFCRPALVNQHLALVGVPVDLKYSIVSIIDLFVNLSQFANDDSKSDASGIKYWSPSLNDYCLFNHFSQYSEFNQEPIAGLAFSLPKRAFPTASSILSVLSSTSSSTMQALYLIHGQPDYSPFMIDKSAYNGHILEVAATTACVLSSHARGFKGMSIAEWLPLLFEELNFRQCTQNENDPILGDSDEFIRKWNGIMIPYFCPQVSVEFSDDSIEMIGKIEPEYNLGSVFCNVENPKGPRDFYFLSGGKIFVNGECKLRERSFGSDSLELVVQRFNSIPKVERAQMHIVIALRIADFKKRDFPKDYAIYKARFDQRSEQYVLQNMNPEALQTMEMMNVSSPESTTGDSSQAANDQVITSIPEKCIILIGLEQIARSAVSFHSCMKRFKFKKGKNICRQ